MVYWRGAQPPISVLCRRAHCSLLSSNPSFVARTRVLGLSSTTNDEYTTSSLSLGSAVAQQIESPLEEMSDEIGVTMRALMRLLQPG